MRLDVEGALGCEHLNDFALMVRRRRLRELPKVTKIVSTNKRSKKEKGIVLPGNLDVFDDDLSLELVGVLREDLLVRVEVDTFLLHKNEITYNI